MIPSLTSKIPIFFPKKFTKTIHQPMQICSGSDISWHSSQAWQQILAICLGHIFQVGSIVREEFSKSRYFMAPYASIAIGIDRYQLFQPLNFASADAQAMEQFFQQSSGWTAERCLLMTDNSASINGHSTFPHQQNIQRWLEHFCWEVLQSGDPVCFFFSGYGLSSNGKEYLMPIDGDPHNPEQTGISLTSLYRLFSAPGLQAMFFLDANRGVNGRGFGEGAAALAAEFEIPTFLSCQSAEFSHEAMGLKQGIFTAVCLEALRSQPNLSLSKLQEYLSIRVPELSEHHWQPLQNPWAILPNKPRLPAFLLPPNYPPPVNLISFTPAAVLSLLAP
jgi:Caspase domain